VRKLTLNIYFVTKFTECFEFILAVEEVTVAVVEYKTSLKKPRKGLCSNWLASLQPGEDVPLWVKQGPVKLPTDPAKPIITVGPGTGCAMFRAYFEERVWQRNQGVQLGPSVFLFGCRHEHKDFLHKHQWLSYVEHQHLTLFDTAFSRDQKDKVYVQHHIEKHSKILWDLIQAGALIYVSGSAKSMPKDVRDAFLKVIRSGNMSIEAAEQFMKDLEKTKRYQCETWY